MRLYIKRPRVIWIWASLTAILMTSCGRGDPKVHSLHPADATAEGRASIECRGCEDLWIKDEKSGEILFVGYEKKGLWHPVFIHLNPGKYSIRAMVWTTVRPRVQKGCSIWTSVFEVRPGGNYWVIRRDAKVIVIDQKTNLRVGHGDWDQNENECK